MLDVVCSFSLSLLPLSLRQRNVYEIICSSVCFMWVFDASMYIRLMDLYGGNDFII